MLIIEVRLFMDVYSICPSRALILEYLAITSSQKIDSLTSFRKGDTDQTTLIMSKMIHSIHQYTLDGVPLYNQL